MSQKWIVISTESFKYLLNKANISDDEKTLTAKVLLPSTDVNYKTYDSNNEDEDDSKEAEVVVKNKEGGAETVEGLGRSENGMSTSPPLPVPTPSSPPSPPPPPPHPVSPIPAKKLKLSLESGNNGNFPPIPETTPEPELESEPVEAEKKSYYVSKTERKLDNLIPTAKFVRKIAPAFRTPAMKLLERLKEVGGFQITKDGGITIDNVTIPDYNIVTFLRFASVPFTKSGKFPLILEHWLRNNKILQFRNRLANLTEKPPWINKFGWKTPTMEEGRVL